ncbi:MAG: hypothetical protein J1F05_00085 [Muribaculaceae bacterium]|nr:hypothetical protein [Muribaculaceae bacterium]
MKKVISIGECSLNIVIGNDGKPMGSMPGGRVANCAAILARKGFEVTMASEASADPVGDIVVSELSKYGVDTRSLDRFTEGHTPINVFTIDSDGKPATITRYEQYPDECFDIIWPKVEEGDVVLYGGYYSIDHRMRQRLSRFLDHCKEMKAILIYLPGFLPQQEPRVTRVMPAILENLEIADVVITRSIDLKMIFGVDDSETAYHSRIDFYCRSLISIDADKERICYYAGREVSTATIEPTSCRTMIWNSGAIAGVVAAIISNGIQASALDTPSEAVRESILQSAAEFAVEASNNMNENWQYIQ